MCTENFPYEPHPGGVQLGNASLRATSRFSRLDPMIGFCRDFGNRQQVGRRNTHGSGQNDQLDDIDSPFAAFHASHKRLMAL